MISGHCNNELNKFRHSIMVLVAGKLYADYKTAVEYCKNTLSNDMVEPERFFEVWMSSNILDADECTERMVWYYFLHNLIVNKRNRV